MVKEQVITMVHCPRDIDRVSPKRLYIANLEEIRGIRREMAKLYKEARKGSLDLQTATRLVYILSQISAIIRDSEIEQRITELEEKLKHKGTS